MSDVHLVAVEARQAREWSLRSLSQGAAVSQLLRERILNCSFEAAIVADVRPRGGSLRVLGEAHLDDESRGMDRAEAERGLRGFFEAGDGEFLVVEDDLGRRGDAALRHQRPSGPRGFVRFIDDRVVHASLPGADPAELVRLIGWGASAYPLNAFLCPEEARAWLGVEEQLSAEDCLELAQAARVGHPFGLRRRVLSSDRFQSVTLSGHGPRCRRAS